MARRPQRIYRQQSYFSRANRLARRAYTLGWTRFAGRVAAGFGGVVAAGAANYFAKVPKLDSDMRIGYKRSRGERKQPQPVAHDKGGYAQLTKARNGRSGRRVSKKAKMSKLLNSHTADYIERFQNVTALNTKTGAFTLDYASSPAGSDYPMYFFDLTCVNNAYSHQGGTVSNFTPYPFTRLLRGPNGFFHYQVAGKTAVDVSNFEWQVEKQPHNFVTYSATKQFIEWVDIRMMLYGARKYPTYCFVEIWQFKDDLYAPRCIASSAATGAVVVEQPPALTTAEGQQYNQFYVGQTDNLIGNPIGTRDLKEYALDKVAFKKFTKKFMFQPTLTTESDVSGHQMEFRLRHQVNKVCNYLQNPIDSADVPFYNVANVDEDNPNAWNTNNRSNLSPFINGKGREFLVIRGFAPVNNIVSTLDSDNAISFDLMIRRKRTMLQGF